MCGVELSGVGWGVLAVCCVEWEAAIADAKVETHDRIVGKTWREAKRKHDETISGPKATPTDTIRTFSALGASLLAARSDGTPSRFTPLAQPTDSHRCF